MIAVISGEMTVAEAARRSKVSEQSIGNWKRQFLEGGKQGLADGGRPGSHPQLQRLEAEVEELKTALGEAHVELRVWKKSARTTSGATKLKARARGNASESVGAALAGVRSQRSTSRRPLTVSR